MRAAAAAVALALLLCGTAAAQCVPAQIVCGDVVRGALTPNDCLRDDLTPQDTFVFSGSAGQTVTAVVYTAPNGFHPDLALVAPDGTRAYRANGGPGGTALVYTLPATGQWKLTLGTHDGLAPNYVMALSCHGAPYVDHPQCVDQTFVCGETIEGSLTLQNCLFHDAPERLYAGGWISLEQGKTFSAVVESADFNPRIGLYSDALGDPIARSVPTIPGRETIDFVAPYTGRYYVLVTPLRDLATHTGRYRFTINGCGAAGCLPPVIADQPADVFVPFGTRATLTVNALGLGPLRYVWSDRNFLPMPVISEGARFTTPPVIARTAYGVTVDSPCGTADSRLVTVTPRDGRSRASRH